MDLIEKLKKNLARYIFLSDKEKDFLKSLPRNQVAWLCVTGVFRIKDDDDWYNKEVYHIVAGYKSEPPKLIVGRTYKITPFERDNITLPKGTYVVDHMGPYMFTTVSQFTVGGYSYKTANYSFELIPESEFIKCLVYTSGGYAGDRSCLMFSYKDIDEYLTDALSFPEFSHFENENGHACAMRPYQPNDSSAKIPVFVVFKK